MHSRPSATNTAPTNHPRQKHQPRLLEKRNGVRPGILLIYGPDGKLLFIDRRLNGVEPSIKALQLQLQACWRLADTGQALPLDFDARIL